MCKYCENKEQGCANIVEKDKDIFMRIVFNYPGKVANGNIYPALDESEDQKVTYIVARSNKFPGHIAAEIHYCPFCGEKIDIPEAQKIQSL